MKEWIILPVTVVASVCASVLGTQLFAPDTVRGGGSETTGLEASVEGLSREVEALRSERDELRSAIEGLRLAGPSSPPGSSRTPIGEDDIDLAVARWMERNAPQALTETPPSDDDDLLGSLKGVDIDELMLMIEEQGMWSTEMWERLRRDGRIDDVIAEYERLAEEDPNNPDLKVSLGDAYLQKIFSMPDGPLKGEYAMKADQAYDQALELDGTHWEARFSKAVSLSNWPPFLGKTGEAIQNFEILAEQQAAGASKPSHSQTYLYLGNLYLQTGDKDKALSTWRHGLSLFPDDAALQSQIDTNSR